MPVSERLDKHLKEVQLHPWKVECDKPGCYYVVCADSPHQGRQKLEAHTCPYRGPTKIGLMMSRTLLENAWLKLDVAVAELHEGTYNEEEVTRMKGVCRGMAEIIALFMRPHFDDGDGVVREAQKRYKAKKAGEDYETPGLGSQRFTPPPGTKNPTQPTKPAKPAHKLSDKEVAAVKFAMESGMFTAADVAKTYGVSEAVVKDICGV